MGQSSFAGILLLVSAHAAPADHYHVRSPTYACVDPQAALALNDPARLRAGSHRTVRQEDRCFRVQPHERWERISHPTRLLLLLRKKPPHPGEPPLYFRSSTVTRLRLPRRHDRRSHHPDPLLPTAAPMIAGAMPGQPIAAPAAPAAAPAPSSPAPSSPAQSISAQPQSASPAPAPTPTPTTATPPAASTVPQVAAPTDGITPHPDRAASPAPVTRPAIAPATTDGVVHRFSPLLLWMAVIALALLLVRLVWRRRLPPAVPDGVDAQEPVRSYPDWRRFRPLRQPGPRPVENTVVEPPPIASQLADTDAPARADIMANASISAGEFKNRCVARLRDAGWDARTRFSADMPGPHVIARNGSLVLALQCHPSVEPVDARAVEAACRAREQQGSHLVAVVSNAPFTEPARQLAARTGIVLLHEDQLASLAD